MGLKGGISIDADSGPLGYLLWCCGSRSQDFFIFIQVGFGHTVKTFSIRWFCIRIERVMTVYWNYNVIAFKSCIQIFTVSPISQTSFLLGIFYRFLQQDCFSKRWKYMLTKSSFVFQNFIILISIDISLSKHTSLYALDL